MHDHSPFRLNGRQVYPPGSGANCTSPFAAASYIQVSFGELGALFASCCLATVKAFSDYVGSA